MIDGGCALIFQVEDLRGKLKEWEQRPVSEVIEMVWSLLPLPRALVQESFRALLAIVVIKLCMLLCDSSLVVYTPILEYHTIYG